LAREERAPDHLHRRHRRRGGLPHRPRRVMKDGTEDRGVSRRSLLKGGAALLVLRAAGLGHALAASSRGGASTRPVRKERWHIALVGDGAFGGRTALDVLRRGAGAAR